VLYMIASALAFAGLDLIRKLLAGRIDALALVLFMSLGAVPFLGGLLALHGLEAPSPGYLLPGLGALALNFLGSLGFVHSVKLSPLSRTIPLLSLTPVFTALTAVPLLGELPEPTQAAGILLVVVGAMALNSGGSLGGAVRGFLREKGALLMAAVALMWAVSGPLDKLALEHASVYFHATAMAFGVGVGALAALAWQQRLPALGSARGEARLLLAAMICITVALTFQLLAIRVVLVSLVEAFKRALGSLIAVVLGGAVFGEKVGPGEWISVAVMVGGVFLMLG
jgi:drug/metabolite transporter (DMT)-like permease